MHRLTQPLPNCYLLLFKNQKDLAMTFCRVQEFYESDKPELKGKFFTFADFIESQMDKNGNIHYFDTWDGFNVPGHIFKEWLSNLDETTRYENELLKVVNTSVEQFYIIGALEKDKATINHEIAHALFYIVEDYKIEMSKLNDEFKKQYKGQYNKLVKELKKMGYAEDVLFDEIQAYMSTSKNSDLVDYFALNTELLKPLITQYKKVLRKYNTYNHKA